LASGLGGGSGPRLQNNARAIEQYAQNFSNREIDILPDLDLSFTADGVRVKINPDLHVSEGGREKIVKLEFAKDEPLPEVVKIICQAMFDAAAVNGHKYTAASVLYFDVARGTEHRGARQRARMKGEIDAALKNIVSLWPCI